MSSAWSSALCLIRGTQPVGIPIITAHRASKSVNTPTQTIVVQLVLRYNARWRIPIRVVSDILLVHVLNSAPIEWF